jgi:hypothetical protein
MFLSPFIQAAKVFCYYLIRSYQTVGAVCMTNAKYSTNERFAVILYCVNKNLIIFFRRRFLSLFPSTVNNFRRILNYILIGLFIPMPVVKNQEGYIFELFSLKCEKTDFYENRYAKSITNTTGAPPAPVIALSDGQTLEGHSSRIL